MKAHQPIFYLAAGFILAGILVVLNADRLQAFRSRTAASQA